ncbi:cytochrome P450 [Colletotrichum somersetense]|nr:cytochrome P450 [Colletotrichum somersetense]
MIYNVALHPLRKYPGPKLWAATRIPYALMVLRGDTHKTILTLHQRYDADVVRISPNELSFQHPDAWKDIMGHCGGTRSEENEKDPDTYNKESINIISASRYEHARLRRILSHGFSARIMEDQQPLIQGYVDLFIERLCSLASKGPIDIKAWYNYTTFDIIGDLAFGEPFGCLARSDYHPWVRITFESVKMLSLSNLARSFWFLEPLLKMLIPRSLVEKGKLHNALIHEKVDRRIAFSTPRPDFAEAMLRKGAEPLTREEICENCSVLIVAGSETTATALSGITYLLTTNPDILVKLSKEVRSSFVSEEEINIQGTTNLKYLNAVIEEGLRIYPPAPLAQVRRTPPAGAQILGQWVPGNTTVGISQWALYHRERFFSRPFEFHPERWLGDPAFNSDCPDVFHPFHVGPRNCIGKNLAYAEMRMILARVIWTFDLRLDDVSRDWLDQPTYIIWAKPSLMVHLTKRQS